MSAAKIENGIYKYFVSYIKQLYVIKFVNDLHQVGGFLRVAWFPLPQNDCHDKTEILLNVTLNTPDEGYF